MSANNQIIRTLIFESHKIIHDYDYWAINYPVSLKIEPVDWGGVNTYFGNI